MPDGGNGVVDDVMWLGVGRAIREMDSALLFEIYVRLLTIADALEKQQIIRRKLEELLDEPMKLRGIS